ncbi:MAG: replication initiation protein [Ruminococcus sp.]|nr:replication initiation protein [Ruminococcus sp.]MBR6669955.1 replication initiation protein [Ruminococcus sp.]
MSELFDTAIVEKRNVLNELRSNNMTVQELRFFSIYLSKINPWDVSTRNVRFPIVDFQRIMGFGKLNISQLRASTDSLLCKLVHVPNESGYGYTAFQLFKECRLDRDENEEWYIEIDAHDKALPLMFEFKNKYFKYELWNALRLKSPNQVRMYEILKQYEKIGKRELAVAEIRELLGVGKKEYSGRTGWSDFKKYVLDSCQQALKENTDICFTYEKGKSGKGGKWLTIVFYIEKNDSYKDPLTLNEFIGNQADSTSGEAPEKLDTVKKVDTNINFSENDSINEEVGERDYKNSIYFDIPEFDEMEEAEETEIHTYKNKFLSFLAIACDEEFSEVEMEYIFKVIKGKQLPEHQMGINFAREEYLEKMYSKFKIYAEKKNIQKENRYNYFCRMLENHISE